MRTTEYMGKCLSYEPKKQILNYMHLMMVVIQKVSLNVWQNWKGR